MRMLFRQRFFSWLDSYDIYNEYKNVLFTVKGKLSFGHRLVIYDAEGREVGEVREVLLTFLPKFDIIINGVRVGTIRKEFSFFKPKFDIDFNGWHIEGNWFEWDYSIIDRNGDTIASISKELFHLTDTYSIEVYDPSDALTALALVLAIDAEKCSRNK